MTVFWSLATLMLMVALLFILPSLLRHRQSSVVSTDDLNTAVIKTQLAELKADLAAGKLDQASFDAARKDLERELLYDLATPNSDQQDRPPRSGRWITLLLAPALPLCAVLLYQQLGSVELIDTLQRSGRDSAATVEQGSSRAPSLDQMADQLTEHLRTEPDDLQGWTMLAKTYKVLHRHELAINAYQNILQLGGDNDAAILADYADALVMSGNGAFTEQAGELLQRALQIQPDNIKALWLAGHWKKQTGNNAAAIDYWQQAAMRLPPDGQDATLIAAQIQQARQQGGVTPADAARAPVSATAATDRIKLQVHVALDLAQLADTRPDDTVFIFARAVKGPRMPLAIVRKQVKDLPVTVTLDDSMAMSPAMVLSKFDQVSVGARISRTGNAMPRSGDLQGTVSPVTTGSNEEITLIIDSKVP